jgi:RHS repeat-associated protein
MHHLTFGLFGEVYATPGVSASSKPVMYGFAGYQLDAESGNYRTPYRAYSPNTGRWLSQEPSGADGPNLYHYVFNNPLRYVDPDGLKSQRTARVGVGFVAGSAIALGFGQAPAAAILACGGVAIQVAAEFLLDDNAPLPVPKKPVVPNEEDILKRIAPFQDK